MSLSATTEPPPAATPGSGALPLILVVEDDPSIGVMIEEMLSGKQYEVRLETGPTDALNAIADREPDLVLMDINLGADIDGIETVQRMRKTADVPVCFITAYSDEATVARAEAVGPMAYLVKPFEMGDVAAMVKISLASAKRIKEKIRQATSAAAPASRDAILSLDPSGALLSASPAACQLLGWDTADPNSPPASSLLRLSAAEQAGEPAETESILRSLIDAAISGSPTPWRGWFRPASGPSVPLLINATADPSGNVACQLRKIPAAALRLGKNAGVGAVAASSTRPNGALAEADVEDALTGLPNRNAILSRIDYLEETGLSLFVLFIEHMAVLRQRFGSGAIDRILLSYTQHLAQHLPTECQLARWDSTCFVILPKPEAGQEMEREISRVLSSPMLYHLQLAGRSALLRVTSAFSICKPGVDGPLVDQIETHVHEHGRR